MARCAAAVPTLLLVVVAAAAQDCTFSDKSGVECDGLSQTTAGDASSTACEKACCASTACLVWQWQDPAQDPQWNGCWTGPSCRSSEAGKHWKGGVRAAPGPGPAPAPPPAPPPAPVPPGQCLDVEEGHDQVGGTKYESHAGEDVAGCCARCSTQAPKCSAWVLSGKKCALYEGTSGVTADSSKTMGCRKRQGMGCNPGTPAPPAPPGPSPPGPTPSGRWPASDPDNKLGWKLVDGMSDEFDGGSLDTQKWAPGGRGSLDGGDPNNRLGWWGRAPSAFNTDNSVVSGGELQLQAKWEPGWKGFKGLPKDDDSGAKYKDITCGMVTSQKKILRGYFEIRAKVANISMSSAFWLIGGNGEIDIFEMIGRSNKDPSGWTAMPTDIECPDSDNKVYDLGYLTAGSYHTYGLEWDCDYLKYYANGRVVRTLKKSEAWCFDKPECLVLTQEAFSWEGIPTEDQMTSKSLSERTYHIDYWRTWQKAGGYDCKSSVEVGGGC